MSRFEEKFALLPPISTSYAGESLDRPPWDWRLRQAFRDVKSYDLRRLASVSIYPLLVRFCFVAIVLSNNIDITRSLRGEESVSLSFQVLLKLSLVGLALLVGGWCFIKRPSLVQVFKSVPGFLVLLLMIWHYITCVTAVMPAVAFASAFAFTGLVLITIANLDLYGARQVFVDAAFGMGLYAILGIGLGFVMPELTIFREYISNDEFIARFGGLGHPNTLGAYVVLCFVIALGLAIDGELAWPWAAAAFVLCLYVLSMAVSRTPVIAGTLAIGVIAFPRLTLAMRLSMLACAALLVWTWLFVDAGAGTEALQSTMLKSVTKTGEAEELTSATGRTEIWAFAARLIAEQPLVGWGSGSTPVKMTGVSGHSHNILLQPTVTLGFPGGGLVVLLLLYNLWLVFSTRSAMVGLFVLFLLVLGCVESPILGPFPDGTTLMWLSITLFIPVLQFNAAHQRKTVVIKKIGPSSLPAPHALPESHGHHGVSRSSDTGQLSSGEF